MANSADELQDELIARQVMLLRLSNRLRDQIDVLMADSTPESMAILQRELDRLGEVSALDFADRTAAIELLISRTVKPRADGWKAAEKLLTSELLEIGSAEAAATVEAIGDALPVKIALNSIPAEQIRAAVTKRPFEGRVLKEWAQGLAEGDKQRMASTIRAGVIEGRTVDEITRAVRGTKSQGFKDGILNVSRNQSEAIVRTAVNHVTNSARNDVFEANSDIIAGVKWVATLDGRTTPICQDRDGRVTMYNDNPLPKGFKQLNPKNARPPAHWQCRSVMTAIFDPDGIADQIGERPFVRDARTRRRREIDFRAQAKEKAGSQWRGTPEKRKRELISNERRQWTRENVGRVSQETTYGDWLKRQPKDFQDEVLGPARGKLFRSGAVPIEGFVDRKGMTLTLKELDAKLKAKGSPK